MVEFEDLNFRQESIWETVESTRIEMFKGSVFNKWDWESMGKLKGIAGSSRTR